MRVQCISQTEVRLKHDSQESGPACVVMDTLPLGTSVKRKELRPNVVALEMATKALNLAVQCVGLRGSC